MELTRKDGVVHVRPALAPVVLEIVRVCRFAAKPCKDCGLPKANRVHAPDGPCEFRRQNGCATCQRNKGDRAHYGQPPSFNVMASGPGAVNHMAYANLKRTWQGFLTDELNASGLPKGLGYVLAEGEITFPGGGLRDQGNFRVILEKSLGDALERGGWLPDDSWAHYEFGQLSMRIAKGESATRLTLFPRYDPLPLEAPDPQERMDL